MHRYTKIAAHRKADVMVGTVQVRIQWTHSLKPPGFGFNSCDYEVKTWFQSLLSNG
jgi:hypothetical protein